VFRNRGKIKTGEKWSYGDRNHEIAHSFCYLVLMFYYKGNFNDTQINLSVQGLKAMYSLMPVRNTICISI
jgi:hypothetical protein